jgi:hypothetical protein
LCPHGTGFSFGIDLHGAELVDAKRCSPEIPNPLLVVGVPLSGLASVTPAIHADPRLPVEHWPWRSELDGHGDEYEQRPRQE